MEWYAPRYKGVMSDSKEGPKKSPIKSSNVCYCPVCGWEMYSRTCKQFCSNPRCSYFESCNEGLPRAW